MPGIYIWHTLLNLKWWLSDTHTFREMMEECERWVLVASQSGCGYENSKQAIAAVDYGAEVLLLLFRWD